MSAAENEVVDETLEQEATGEREAGQPDYLNMSDEELLALDPPKFVAQEASTEQVETNVAAAAGADNEDDQDGKKKPEGEQEAPAADATLASAAGAEGEQGKEVLVEGDKGAKTEVQAPAEGEKTEGDKEPKTEKVEAPAINFEAEYKRLLTPFKANGKEIAVESVDDAIALMQMGANYNKKMAALKPNLKLMKLLENNGLMSEEKLSFLIDLDKKDPAAINKLVKDSGLDPMDLDAEKAGAYKPTPRTVDDREIELDTVLDELKDSPTYTRTLDVVSNKWDGPSKQLVSQQPQLLKVIDDHVASGIYDLISTGVERERMLGRLQGLSDLEAYRQVGDAINARGGFAHLVKTKEQPKPAAAPVVVTPKPKVEDEKVKDAKRAASASRSAAPTTTPKDFNPLSMSDEEFSKINPKFL